MHGSEPHSAGKAVVAHDDRPKKDRRRKNVIIVAGMHRSGTSALTRTLSLLGCSLPRTMKEPALDNERGFWEPLNVGNLCREIQASAGAAWDDLESFNPGWYRSPTAGEFRERALTMLHEEFGDSRLFVLKHPLICRLLPFWIDVLEVFEATPLIVCPIRNPLDVAASLEARNKLEPSIAQLMWLRYVLDAEAASRGRPRAFARYEDLLDDWQGVTDRVSEQLGLSWPRRASAAEQEIETFLTPDLRHHLAKDTAVLKNMRLSAWVRRSFEVLSRWAQDGVRMGDETELDRLRTAFDEAAPAFRRPLAVGREATLRGRKLEREVFSLNARLAARNAQANELADQLKTQQAEASEISANLAARDAQANELAEQLKAQQAETSEISAKLQASEGMREALEDQIAETGTQRASLEREWGQVMQVLLRQLAKDEAEIAAAVDVRDRLERTKRHLSYRLGQALLEGTRSVGGLVRLPALLVKANRAYRRDKASPPALQGEGDAAALAPSQFVVGPDPKVFGAAAMHSGSIAFSARAIGWGTEAEAVLVVAVRYRDQNGSIVPLSGQGSAASGDADVREVAAKPLQRFQLEFRCPPNAAQMEAAFASATDARILVCIDDMVVSQGGAAGGKPHTKTSSRPQDKPAKELRAKHARELDDKLWGGFSRYALEDLERFKRSRTAAPQEVSYAAWALARWHGAQKDHERALENVVAMRLADRTLETDMGQVLLEADCLVRLGDGDSARDILQRMLELRPDDPNLCLAMANTHAPVDGPGDPKSDEIRLSWINRVYEREGLLPLVKSDPGRPLGIDNLATAVADRVAPVGQPKVSVIMPVYKAEETLPFALRGLMAQTWRNLEIIVVDDYSPDDTFAVAEAFAARDPRIHPIRQALNQGPYVARNRALEIATGDLVTVHDSDDWSHSQKIETQVRYSLTHKVAGTLSHWARLWPNLRFSGNWRPSEQLYGMNHSSLMVKTAMLHHLGGWDPVRFGADNELIWRLYTKFGKASIPEICLSAPLAFALEDPKSLTRRAETNVRTFFYGVRKDYRDAYSRWHRTAATSDDFTIHSHHVGIRRFPAPRTMLATPTERRYNAIIIADCAEGRPGLDAACDRLASAVTRGDAIGVFHWPHYDGPTRAHMDERIVAMIDRLAIDIITAGQSTKTVDLVAFASSALEKIPDGIPDIKFERLLVLSVDEADKDTPHCVRETLEGLFGCEGVKLDAEQSAGS